MHRPPVNSLTQRSHIRAPILDERDLLEKQLPIKYDPYDHTIAWVYVHQGWVKCLSQDHYTVQILTESEMRVCSAEKSRRNTMFSRRSGERAEQLAQGAMEDQKVEAALAKNLVIIRGKQREDAGIRGIIDGKPAEHFDGKQIASIGSPQYQQGMSKRSTVFSSVADDEVQILEDYV